MDHRPADRHTARVSCRRTLSWGFWPASHPPRAVRLRRPEESSSRAERRADAVDRAAADPQLARQGGRAGRRRERRVRGPGRRGPGDRARAHAAASSGPQPKRKKGNGPTSDAAISNADVLKNGIALPPIEAPEEVRLIIEAGNQIARTPYLWGGGHGKWLDHGYDCSGSVSFALANAGLLAGPQTPGG